MKGSVKAYGSRERVLEVRCSQRRNAVTSNLSNSCSMIRLESQDPQPRNLGVKSAKKYIRPQSQLDPAQVTH